MAHMCIYQDNEVAKGFLPVRDHTAAVCRVMEHVSRGVEWPLGAGYRIHMVGDAMEPSGGARLQCIDNGHEERCAHRIGDYCGR